MHNNASAFCNKSENKNKVRYAILFLTKWYPNKFDPQLGVFVRKHAKAVSDHCNVAVVYACADGTLYKNYKTSTSTQRGFTEILTYYKRNNSVFKWFINSYRYINANRIGIREVQKKLGVIDLIHVNVLTRPGVIALIIKKVTGIPYVITEHWTGYVSGNYEKSAMLKKWLTRVIIKNASAVTTVSTRLKEKMLAFGLNNNYIIVPNVVETIVPPEPCNNFKTKILTIADLLDSQKNISGTIRAIGTISKRYPNIEYHIIGDGPDESMLRDLSDALQLTDQCIFFHGRQTNDFVYDFLKQIDFVVINSNFETFSVVAAEALANGKPVISTISGGPEEFITTDHGILIERGNQQQLEDAIVKMMLEFKNYDSRKLNKYITEKFNYQTVGEQFYTIYKPLIPKR